VIKAANWDWRQVAGTGLGFGLGGLLGGAGGWYGAELLPPVYQVQGGTDVMGVPVSETHMAANLSPVAGAIAGSSLGAGLGMNVGSSLGKAWKPSHGGGHGAMLPMHFPPFG
jgi:hypothetical protein